MTRDKDCLLALHAELGITGKCLSKKGKSLALEWLKRLPALMSEINKFHPDLCVGVMGATLAPAARACSVPSLIFYDTEVARLSNALVFRLATRVVVPEAFATAALRDRSNVNRYPGYKEFAYLHPERHAELFRCGDESSRKKRILFRGISPTSIHDAREDYWGVARRDSLLNALSSEYDLTVSMEGDVPGEFASATYAGKISAFHRELARCDAVVSESATVAMEGAMLGKPGWYLSRSPRGYLECCARETGFIRFGFLMSHVQLLAEIRESMAPAQVSARLRRRTEWHRQLRDPLAEILFHADQVAKNAGKK